MATQPLPPRQEATGYSATYDLRQGIDNAVSKLPPANVPRTVLIASMEAKVGGFPTKSEGDGLYVTIELVKPPSR